MGKTEQWTKTYKRTGMSKNVADRAEEVVGENGATLRARLRLEGPLAGVREHVEARVAV